ncbi:hypothetical protein BT93_E2087 [Corymbia citriodora subsp. variegata]|nr:hypothetical protein BT93_E2087 [Corymbia citriodora subsp. variegata]KAF8029562.1 hypothetical protein BT93_E2087 [Corymbia citriodora subsp. variegata]
MLRPASRRHEASDNQALPRSSLLPGLSGRPHQPPAGGEEEEAVPEALPGGDRGHYRGDEVRRHEAPQRRRQVHASSGSSGSDSGSDGEAGEVVSGEEKEGEEDVEGGLSSDGGESGESGETWIPSMEGFVQYLVNSKLVFDTVERIVDESSDVAYAYFTKTGLERSEGLSKDLEWFSQQNVAIPNPSNAGISYSKYLEELAEKSAPLFLSHFYNIYFSHIAGGQLIVNQKILEGRHLEFCQWEGDVHESLKGVREKLNMLGEHWSRDEKNKCLREATKCFRYMGQIVRLIIL